MEYIENSELERIAGILSNYTMGNYFLSTRFEAFSSTFRKSAPTRRKRSNSVNNKVSGEISPYLATGMMLSAEINNSNLVTQQNNSVVLQETTRMRSSSFTTWQLMKPQRRRTSSLGELTEPSTRALFMDFITTLNTAFPDYDFADTKIDQFKDDTVGYVLQVVNNHLAEVTLRYPDILDQLWSTIDEIINLKACEVFRFSPDVNDEDAHSAIWQFHYFFFNKELNRLCYISCVANSVLRRDMDYGSDDDEDEDREMSYSPVDQSGSEMDYDDYGVARSVKAEGDDDSTGDVPDWDGII